MATTVRRNPPIDLVATTLDLVTNKGRAADLTKRANKARDLLIAYIEKHAKVTDEKGSQFLPLPETVSFGGTTFAALKREKRASTVFLEEDATEILRKRGLYDLATTTVTVTSLDQDKIYVLNQEGKISDDEIDAMFGEVVTWALIPQKGDDPQDFA